MGYLLLLLASMSLLRIDRHGVSLLLLTSLPSVAIQLELGETLCS